MMKERLLKVRKEQKRRQPAFKRLDSNKRNRLAIAWRRMRGLHSKVRHMRRGALKRPEPGFGAPRLVRGLSPTGLEIVRVTNPEVVSQLDPKTQGALLSGMGLRKKVAAVMAALERKVTILNLKNPDTFLAEVRERFAKKKEAKKTVKKEKTSIEAVVQKEAKEAPLTPEEKALQDQKERDKVLTHKE